MSRRFPIAALRTLVARALQSGSYTPAESGRIRAVPDTRTIRYYTTLGLIDRPAEMHGRTAMYSEQHVLQLVAIKRLQAENQTLSGIQAQLVGITPRKLRSLANLSADFWAAADRYLATRNAVKPKAARAKQQTTDEHEEFWAEPAALPGAMAGALPTSGEQEQSATTRLSSCVRVSLHPDVQLIVEAISVASEGSTPIDVSRLQTAAVPLLNELARQGLLDVDSSIPSSKAPPAHQPNPSLSPGDSQ